VCVCQSIPVVLTMPERLCVRERECVRVCVCVCVHVCAHTYVYEYKYIHTSRKETPRRREERGGIQKKILKKNLSELNHKPNSHACIRTPRK
jgi:hypothetical protein